MKFLMSFLMVLGLVGCGVVCKDAPPRYAEYIKGGGHGMQYHFALYYPQGDAGHTPGRCTNYEYSHYDIYMNNLGTLNGSEVLWYYSQGQDAYFDSIKERATFTISKKEVKIDGLYDGNEYLNGVYPVR